MTRNELNNLIITTLKPYQPSMIGLFGSYARGEEREDSDIDLLIDIRMPITLFDLIKLEEELSKKTGKRFDIVTLASIHNSRLKEYIFKDFQSLI
ncbi:MAG: nucleotidyltransferase domain-containing protein [Bacteroidetes bacterium]|nr:nucleotidyltransferase domain-containing protein [Bacteroidota bacterium]